MSKFIQIVARWAGSKNLPELYETRGLNVDYIATYMPDEDDKVVRIGVHGWDKDLIVNMSFTEFHALVTGATAGDKPESAERRIELNL